MNLESTSQAGPESTRPLWRVRVEAWILVASVVVAFLGGFLFAGLGDDDPEVTQVPTGFQNSPSQFTPIAPPLDESELQGGLPAGHPDLGEGDVAPGETVPGETVPGESTTTVPATTETTAGG